MSERQPRIAVVTRSWGGEDDAPEVTRLIAGALAIHGDVEIVHLTETDEVETSEDSVFTVHTVPLIGAHPGRAAVALAATAAAGNGSVPPALGALLERWEGDAPETGGILRRIAPDVVVLAGASQPFDLAVLDKLDGGPRIVFVPMTPGQEALVSERYAAAVRRADVIGAIHPGEEQALRDRFDDASVVALDIALPLNRSATAQGLFGVGWFGSYVVLIRRFPAAGGRYEHSVTHDVLRGALGRVAIAEVDGTKWRVSDEENTAELPVNPTRVNLWRLMANGLMTVDVRPADLFGREAIESMLLGTPVLVPDGSAAKAHVAAADGGLWYRDLGEILDGARALFDEPTRLTLGCQGRSYAEAHHGDMDGFVTRIGALIGAF